MPVSRSPQSVPSPVQAQRTARRRQPARTTELAVLQSKVFELTPDQLRHYLETLAAGVGEADADTPPDPPELPQEDIHAESELEDPDPDAMPVEEEASPWQERGLSLFAPEADPFVSPLLDLSGVYALRVLPIDSDRWACRFEAPTWMGQAPARLRPDVARLRRLLHLLGALLEGKQAFLAQPSAEHFLAGEEDFNAHPIVTQKGLLERLNRDLAGEERYGEDHLSRLLKYDKVWLLWPHACMPLAALFDRPFRLAWAVKGCLELQPERPMWRVVQLPTREQKTLAKAVRAQSLTERLAMVADRAGLPAADILEAVRGEGGHEREGHQ